MIIRLAERPLNTKYGTFNEVLYYDGRAQSIALVKGDVENADNVLCRVHSHCVGAHIFNSIECDCREQMEAAQALIEREGRGVIVWLDQEGKGNGHLALIQSIKYKKELGQAEAYVKAGYQSDARDFSAAAQILEDLGVRSIVMLANNPEKADHLRRVGVVISDSRRLNAQ